jgi:hypothetical protein
MNFLSHFYFDRATADPYRVMGGVLPDLVRNARKDWTFRPEKHSFDNSSAEVESVLIGWKQHIQIDRIFHCSEFFMHHTATIRTAIAPVLERSPVRPSFLAHIALELMLDSLLQTEEILDPDNFYHRLSECSHVTLKQFLTLNNADKPELFFPFLEEFIHSKYIHTYKDPGQVMYALNRICMRVWDDPFTDTQKMQLTSFLPDYQEQLKGEFMEIFHEIGKQLD